MTDPWGTPDPNAQPTVPSDGRPGPSLHKPAYGTPPAGYGAPSAGWAEPTGDGPVGTVRGTGISILLFVVTLGIYSYIYNYKVHTQMQRHSHRGLGGGVALLLTFLVGAMPFVTPSEVGALYSRRGEKNPVSGWTGLWVILPALAGYLAIIIAIVAAAAGSSTSEGGDQISTGAGVAVIGVVVLGMALALAGAITWFVKTNGALNRYWISVGATR